MTAAIMTMQLIILLGMALLAIAQISLVLLQQQSEPDALNYTERMILHSIKDQEIYFCEGELDEFIEAAQRLGFEYDYCRNSDSGFDFMAWNTDEDEEVARIKL